MDIRDEMIKGLNDIYAVEEKKSLASVIERIIVEERMALKPAFLAEHYLTKFRDLDLLEFKRGTFSWDVMITFFVPLEDMPLFVSDPHVLTRSIAQWRLKIGR